MKKNLLNLVGGLLVLASSVPLNAQAYTEDFNDITLLAGNGWFMQNNSTPLGVTGWSQGPDVAGGGPFDAFNGPTNSFISANFNNTTGGTGTISNWLVTPNRTLRNGDVFTFYTRKPSPDTYPDRLEVRLSTNGASTNVGTGGAGIGDFTTVLLTINPSLVTGVYPTAWTQYTITISGLPAPTSGRIAFRYFVTNGGPTGANSDFIAIDAVQYTPYVCPTLSITPTTLANGTAGTAYTDNLSQTGALGAPSYAVTAGALPPGLTLSAAGTLSGIPTATGTFNFTVTVSDASGCTGSQAYSLTIVCPLGGASLSSFPALCSNGTPYTLVEGAPAGGTYSGTGVSGGIFDPTAGSQTITYDLIDVYGCAQSANALITVNTAPTVTQTPFTATCDNTGLVTLSGGSPAGGTYTGTGVSGGQFDPSTGTQTITYSYTDGNGCSNNDSEIQTVNVAPTVTLATFTATCDNAGLITLSGGAPAGGTYSGTGVTGGDFDPTSGTQTITYTYTDGNGCANSDAQSITVNTAPTVTQTPFTAVCNYAADIALSGGSPAGGIYSGTGVTGGNFDPSSGTQSITYTYTDANGCSNNAVESFTVNPQPTVGLSAANNTVCVTYAPVTLTGTPAGGTYFGSAALTGNMFDPAVAGVGSYPISYAYTDASTGCMDTASTTIVVNGCAGINENDINSMITLYPNPAEEMIMVSFDVNVTEGAYVLEIYTVEGKMLFNKEINIDQSSSVEILNISQFNSGTYLMKIHNNKGEQTVKRFIKK